MNLSEEPEFKLRAAQLFALYPNAQASEATFGAWFRHMQALPMRAVVVALERAPSAFPTFVPTAEQVKAIAEVEALAMRVAASEQRQQLLLPPPDGEKADGILQAFYAACDKLLGTGSDDKLDLVDVAVLEGVLVLLFRYYAAQKYAGSRFFADHVDAAVKRYREGNSDERKGPIDVGMLKPTVNHFRSRKYSTRQAVFGLRLVPRWFARHPSLGMMDELIQHGRATDWPDGFRRYDTDSNQPAASEPQTQE